MSQNLGYLPSPLSHNVTLRRPPSPFLMCDVIYGCPLNGCEAGSLSLREERRLRIFEKKDPEANIWCRLYVYISYSKIFGVGFGSIQGGQLRDDVFTKQSSVTTEMNGNMLIYSCERDDLGPWRARVPFPTRILYQSVSVGYKFITDWN